ncbi:MAG: hypothetical protein AAF222_02345 [Pseudomonadota bacterium]
MNVVPRHCDNDPSAGARNLLLNCAGCQPGDRVLIVFEAEEHGYFDRDVLHTVQREALRLGLEVSSFDVGFKPTRNRLPSALTKRLGLYDVVLFLARLGDQLRFSNLPKGPKFIVCFASNRYLLGSRFGRANYDALCRVKQAIDSAIHSAQHVTLRCPNGTQVTGHVRDKSVAPQDTTALRFPMSVFSPVAANAFSGQVALGGFLTGTGSSYYDDYSVEFEGPVFAEVKAGRLVAFHGAPSDVSRANAQYDRVSETFGLDRNCVHSWHAGIHPGCGFPWDLRRNYELWGGAAFGNPRVLHFHTCGADAPGEISWNVFDPTIEVDGVCVWENGRLQIERLTNGCDILDDFPGLRPLFADPDRNIGLRHAH